ncbi:hypothetical protein GSI_06485 [Ganoderma sinense ZZ0214-1]|uniref:Uncharacterized protein n=1 Tax=Ganoderma sinense ZZ0214-1 TaxID=1077348 RepID=A0A2G8SDG9_9APHY|nr:hypothetical protein GSI_06485 [Ganoderma sinense ZZ0214-1]
MADFSTMQEVLRMRQSVQEDLRPYALRAVTADWEALEAECADETKPIRRQVAYEFFASLEHLHALDFHDPTIGVYVARASLLLRTRGEHSMADRLASHYNRWASEQRWSETAANYVLSLTEREHAFHARVLVDRFQNEMSREVLAAAEEMAFRVRSVYNDFRLDFRALEAAEDPPRMHATLRRDWHLVVCERPSVVDGEPEVIPSATGAPMSGQPSAAGEVSGRGGERDVSEAAESEGSGRRSSESIEEGAPAVLRVGEEPSAAPAVSVGAPAVA